MSRFVCLMYHNVCDDADLASAKRTPSLSYIVPDRCHDGSPGPCPGGGAGGLPAADGLPYRRGQGG